MFGTINTQSFGARKKKSLDGLVIKFDKEKPYRFVLVMLVTMELDEEKANSFLRLQMYKHCILTMVIRRTYMWILELCKPLVQK